MVDGDDDFEEENLLKEEVEVEGRCWRDRELNLEDVFSFVLEFEDDEDAVEN